MSELPEGLRAPTESQTTYQAPAPRQQAVSVAAVHRSQFDFLTTLGQGAFGQVYLVQKKHDKQLFALKVLEKDHIIKYDKIESVFRERNIGEELSCHPNMVSFEATFQDENNLYFLLEYVEKGSLSGLLKQYKTLSADLARFYAAEIISALEFMHSKNIVHRDLKPDNILMTKDYHCKLTDFGEAKKIEENVETVIEEDDQNRDEQEALDDEMRNSLFEQDTGQHGLPRGSFVGTPLYVTPEMLNDNRSGPATDLWALGCIIYQMRVGNVPFNGQHEQEVFQKITDRQLQFPNDLEPEAIDLIDQLLHLDPQQRLGSGPKGSLNSMEMLKQHPYFQGLSFKNLAKQAPPVPYERYDKFFNQNQKKYNKRTLEEVLINGDMDEVMTPEPKPQPQQAKQSAAQSKDVQNKSGSSSQQEQQIVMQGVVKRVTSVFQAQKPCLNLNLQAKPYPRLWITSTLDSDGKEGIYKKDILLYGALKVTLKRNQEFEILCTYTKKKYHFQSAEAQKWHKEINNLVLEIQYAAENFDQYLS